MSIINLTPQQRSSQAAFRRFASEKIAPHACRFDSEERVPLELVRDLAAQGYLGSLLKGEWGGLGLDMMTYGVLTEEVGRACSSVRSLLTVHDMVARAVAKWGTQRQRETWLPRLARGELTAALAVSEPNVGSDARGVETTAARGPRSYVLNGRKKWITFGQLAGLFLVLARCEGKPTAFLVERDRPGLTVRPIAGMLGVRASMLAELEFDGCEVPRENLIGREGFGLSSVVATALCLGRYSVACGCVGIAQASLDASVKYAGGRRQFGVYLSEHQLIRQMLTEMVVNVRAARLLCQQAGRLLEANDPKGIMETFIAKYFSSRAATEAASAAVQIHGANGCSGDYPVQRYLRDAKIMEIIEGSNQIQQITIADCVFQEQAWEAAALNAA